MKAKKKSSSNRHRSVPQSRRQRVLIMVLPASYLLNVVLLILATQMPAPLYNRQMNGFQVGRIAETDIVADREMTYTDREKTDLRKEEAAAKILPVYEIDEMKILDQIGHFERFSAFFFEDGQRMTVQNLFEELSLRFPNTFSREDAVLLSRTEDLADYLPVLEEVLKKLMEQGIFPSKLAGIENEGEYVLEFWHWRENRKVHESYTGEQIVTIDEVQEQVRSMLSNIDMMDTEIRELSIGLLSKFAVQNVYYDPNITVALRESAVSEVQPVEYTIRQGQTIVRQGDLITPEDMQMIQALIDQRPGMNFRESVAIVIYMAGIYFLSYIMFFPLISKHPRTMQYSYILMTASVLFTLNIFLVLAFSLIPAGVPISLGIITALTSMLIATLVTQRVGIISSLLLSLIFFAIPDIDIYTFVFSFLSGITATYLIRNAEKRIDLVTATVKLSGIAVFIIITIGLFQQKNVNWYLYTGGLAIFHALVTGALNLALLPALEHLLNAPTVFRLRELSDTNTAIFKRMITVAPGTYSHSMSVANLAESACKEIGANHLLARVGAYYHDIGKMDQPDYFIENQQERNKHDELTPTLSVAVIKSHVKIGKEKAKELKLPPEVVEIVADHHGSDVISYFYQQAVKKGGENVVPSDFSYNGIPPRSKESAVVMLADTVEAQSRTIKKPTVQKFEKMVWDTIMYKVGRRQLSNSVLSFQEIEKIKNSFVQILAGQFHNRIEYPDQKVQ